LGHPVFVLKVPLNTNQPTNHRLSLDTRLGLVFNRYSATMRTVRVVSVDCM